MMPDQMLGKNMTATDPADVATLAMIEVVRQLADNGKVTNKLLDGMQVELRDVRERVIRIEAVEVHGTVKELRSDMNAIGDRVNVLEAAEDRRKGAVGFADALLKYGPFVIALITALFVLLVATKRIVL